MYKKLSTIILIFLCFTPTHAEDFKIVYLNVDKIMQESIAGKSIKKKLENIYKKDMEKFKKNDESLKKKRKKNYCSKKYIK